MLSPDSTTPLTGALAVNQSSVHIKSSPVGRLLQTCGCYLGVSQGQHGTDQRQRGRVSWGGVLACWLGQVPADQLQHSTRGGVDSFKSGRACGHALAVAQRAADRAKPVVQAGVRVCGKDVVGLTVDAGGHCRRNHFQAAHLLADGNS
jgi:hypothetical protein